MASYKPPTFYEDIFNIFNYKNSLSILYNYAELNAKNTFTNVTTFLSNVYVNSSLSVADLFVLKTFNGYGIAYYSNLKAPIQQQIDGISSATTTTINSTVSVGSTTTVDYSTPASVSNSGTSTSAVLDFLSHKDRVGLLVLPV